MMQSKELTEFYQMYASWLRMGAPDSRKLTRKCGLCHNAYIVSDGWELEREMREQFAAAGLDKSTPFNDSIEEYLQEVSVDRNTHLNEKRIAWVEAHCNG